MILSFSGLDGAGKSTLIAAVERFLKDKKLPYRSLTMYDHVGVYALLRQMRNRITGTPQNQPKVQPGIVLPDEATGVKHAWIIRFIRSRPVKKLVLIADLLVFQLYRLYIERWCKQILLLDRYFYDTLVDLADEQTQGFSKRIFSCIPEPLLPCFIDVDAATSFARKGEYTVEYLAFRYRMYKTIFQQLKQPFFLRNENLSQTILTLLTELDNRIGE